MNRLTREALELLKLHKVAILTPDRTTIDTRSGEDDELLINHGTAQALLRRGLAVRADDDQHQRIALVEGAV